jgi:cytochrome c oxidase assembly factor CtaG
VLPLLHAGHPVTWGAWHVDADFIAILLLACGGYLWSLRYAPGYEARRPAAFFSGVVIVILALTSPLDAAAGWLLSAHMLQHILLTTFGPPLILLGLPSGSLRRFLPPGSRAFRLVRRLGAPFVAGAVFIVNMWVWHIPALYELALEHQKVHELMHACFLATGLLFWWPIIAPLPEASTAGPGARLLYIFVSGFPMGVLALLLLSSQSIIYNYYEGLPSRLWGVGVLDDQQVAGVVMGSVGEIAAFVAFSLIFVRFFLADDSEGQTADRALAP